MITESGYGPFRAALYMLSFFRNFGRTYFLKSVPAVTVLFRFKRPLQTPIAKPWAKLLSAFRCFWLITTAVITKRHTDWIGLTAAALISTVPIWLVFIALQRYFTESLMDPSNARSDFD